MRTTLNIHDDVLADVKAYAATRSISVGEATSKLLRFALDAPMPYRIVDGFVIFDPPPDTPRVTTEMVKKLTEELEQDW
jgi:hypothetical protein